MSDDILDRLMAELHQRVSVLPEGSYTTKLLQGGNFDVKKTILDA